MSGGWSNDESSRNAGPSGARPSSSRSPSASPASCTSLTTTSISPAPAASAARASSRDCAVPASERSSAAVTARETASSTAGWSSTSRTRTGRLLTCGAYRREGRRCDAPRVEGQRDCNGGGTTVAIAPHPSLARPCPPTTAGADRDRTSEVTMTRSTLLRLGATVAFAGATLAACSGTSSTTASPAASTAPTVAASPSTATESASPSTEASSSSGSSSSPEASASSPASLAPSGSPEARTVQVQAGDDRFMNTPVDPTVGLVLTFRNVGQQAHEMVLLRRNDNATAKQTFDDITKLNPADLMKFASVVGVLAADPGQEAQGQITLDQAGDYAIVDLLPVGTTTAPASPDPSAIPSGIPNLTKGLVSTFSVVAPEAS